MVSQEQLYHIAPIISDIKLWPKVGLAAINSNNGGAWRVWALAHGINGTRGKQQTGKVTKAELRAVMDRLEVEPRNRQRWIAEAVHMGLLRPYRDLYYLAGLARAAVRLGCGKVGTPAIIKTPDLFKKGWRSKVWAGYLARAGEKGLRVSQSTKEKLTGFKCKTQQNYQKQIKHKKIRNYARTETPASELSGNPFIDGGKFEDGKKEKIIQRLPDQLVISLDEAKTSRPGRSRKAQKQMNASLLSDVGNQTVTRLFHETSKGIERTRAKLEKAKDTPPWEVPAELFELKKVCNHTNQTNIWTPIAL